MSKAPARARQADGELGIVVGNLAGLDAFDGDALALFCFSDVRPLAGVAGYVDWRTCGALSRTLERKQFGAQLGEAMLVPFRGRGAPRRYFVFGLGPHAACTGEAYRQAATAALAALEQAGVRSPALAAPASKSHPEVEPAFVRAISELAAARRVTVLVEAATQGA